MKLTYNPKSENSEQFINNDEIIDSLEHAEINKKNKSLINDIIAKAALGQGVTHREAILLLDCDDDELNEKIFSLANEIKQRFYGNRIVLFAPLYLSNYCINGCVYCPYHNSNRTILRKKLNHDELIREVTALQDMGHKRLALEMGEHPTINTMEYLLDCIDSIYSLKHKNGAIRRVNVNVAATTVENYSLLRNAGIGTYILFQETYNKSVYESLHPSGPKSNYAYHTEAMDRAMMGGIDDVGIGVLFGLETYRYDFVGLLMHAEHLVARFGVGPHTISVPRLCMADGIDTADFTNCVPDKVFHKIVAVIRLAVPYTGMIVSTRESKSNRERVLNLGVTQISGGSRTSVGGYADSLSYDDDSSSQFEVTDKRSLDEIVCWLLKLGYLPSFCTACYREGRTGDRFMSLLKSEQIANCCQPNALLTLKEYLIDYASDETRKSASNVIEKELNNISNPKVRDYTKSLFEKIKNGERDFRF
ncbi:MAG: [Bacteroidaceae bacterium]|nr:[FeFe] hydrogenase H-cluster radical SAM maturase HydG [Bacteroidaceae bacterium]